MYVKFAYTEVETMERKELHGELINSCRCLTKIAKFIVREVEVNILSRVNESALPENCVSNGMKPMCTV